MTPKSADFGSPTSYLGPGIRFCPISLRPPCMQHLGTSSNLLFYLTPCLWNGDVSDIYRSVAISAQAQNIATACARPSTQKYRKDPYPLQVGSHHRSGLSFRLVITTELGKNSNIPTLVAELLSSVCQPSSWTLQLLGSNPSRGPVQVTVTV